MKSAGGTDRAIKGFNKVGRTTIEVGIVEPYTYTKGARQIDGAAVAKKLDQGIENGKSWPFMRRSVEEAKYKNRVRQALRDATRGQGAAGLHKVGENMALKGKSLIRQTIKTPALSPYTIELKGHAKPLVETGALMRNFAYKLKSK